MERVVEAKGSKDCVYNVTHRSIGATAQALVKCISGLNHKREAKILTS